MCQYFFTHHKPCGHLEPKVPLESRNHCTAVNAAIQFYHDQHAYQTLENTLNGVLPWPKPCPAVHNFDEDEFSDDILLLQAFSDSVLREKMLSNGLDDEFQADVQAQSVRIDGTAKRTRDGRRAYPSNMLKHVQDLAEYQARSVQAPNVTVNEVSYGCGKPGNEDCLTNQTGLWLLGHRIHDWDDGSPGKYVAINWGEQSVVGQQVLTLTVPQTLYRVLMTIPPGDVSIASGRDAPTDLPPDAFPANLGTPTRQTSSPTRLTHPRSNPRHPTRETTSLSHILTPANPPSTLNPTFIPSTDNTTQSTTAGIENPSSPATNTSSGGVPVPEEDTGNLDWMDWNLASPSRRPSAADLNPDQRGEQNEPPLGKDVRRARSSDNLFDLVGREEWD